MSLETLAQQLAARGRTGDSMLVHMSPGEVGGLEALARAYGGQLTINPDTGLPEANFLRAILPAVIGGALTVMSGGAITPLYSAMLVGGGTALATKNLEQGLIAGLGAYGGAGLTGAVGAAGAGAAGAGAAGAGAAAPAAGIAQSSVLPLTGSELLTPAAPYASGIAQGVMPAAQGTVSPLIDQAASGIAQSAATPAMNFQAGLGQIGQDPSLLAKQLGGSKGLMQAVGAAAAPGITGALNEPPKAPEIDEGMIRPYSYEFRRPTQEEEAAEDPFSTRERIYGRHIFTPLTPYPARSERLAAGGPPRGRSVEDNPYYTMSGESGDVFKYLMGQTNAAPRAPARAGSTEILGPRLEGESGALAQYAFDPRTGQTRIVTPAETPKPPPVPPANSNITRDGEIRTGGYSKGGRLLQGPGDGVSDSIPATIDERSPARLATGEFVLDARTVSEIGNGDTRAGAKKLYAMMDAIHRERANAKRGEPSGADKHLRRMLA